MKLEIELIDGKWHVNGNTFNNMSDAERNTLSKFIKEYQIERQLEENNNN